VSPVRTIVSLVVLAVVGGVCLIEMRAGLGQYLSVKELKKVLGGEGDATNQTTVKFEDAKSMLRMAPTEELVRETAVEKVYRYSWYSFLRPLIGEQSPQIFIYVSMREQPVATDFFTSDEEGQAGSGYVYKEPPVSSGPPPLPLPSGDGGAGMGGPGMGPPGGGMMRPPGGGPGAGGPGGGMMRPPGGGFGGGGPGGGSGRRRPAVEGEPEPGEGDAKATEGDAKPAEGDAKPAEGAAAPTDSAPKSSGE
jgi:hypothetical protein